MLGIGIIGAGRILGAHANSAQALPETELVAVADVSAERLQKATDTYGCAGYLDYRRMLEDERVEAVVVGLPHGLHKDATIDSLRAGRHVMLEKPMALDVAECDAMLAAAAESGKVLMVAHSQQFFPVNQAIREAVRSGAIGNVVIATDTWYKPFHEGVRPPWFMDKAQGGGMWPMNGSHMIDRLSFFLDSRVVGVKARVGSPIFGYSATDMGTAILEFANGVYATLVHAGFRDGVSRFEAEMTGTEGQIRVCGDRAGGDSYWRSRDRKWEEVTVPLPTVPSRPGVELRSPAFASELREFALAIQEGREPSVTGEYGRYVVAVLEACEESSRTGREVRLD